MRWHFWTDGAVTRSSYGQIPSVQLLHSLAQGTVLGLSCRTISRHCKTYNFLHRVLLLPNGGCERREAVCLTRASPLLFRVLDKIHLQGTEIRVSLCNRARGKPPTRPCFVEKLPRRTGTRIC